MTVATVANGVAIMLGALLMFRSVLRSRQMLKAVLFVRPRNQISILRLLTLHRALMILFLIGYLVVAYAFLVGLAHVGQAVVAGIFLLGSVFVLVGVTLETRLFNEMRDTLTGLVPICSKCRKVLKPGASEHDVEAWSSLESLITDGMRAEFTHGWCPDCRPGN